MELGNLKPGERANIERMQFDVVLNVGSSACSGCPTTAPSHSGNDICTTSSRPDCRQSVEFFDKLQTVVGKDDRSSVASMIHYPLRVRLHGKNAVIRDKAQLLRDYDSVFDSPVRCALAHANRADVWGNWQGFTVASGVMWWERSHSPTSPFRLIAVNNGAFYEGCGEPK
jgi:hypothetical protein